VSLAAEILLQSWNVLLESAPFLLLGFAAAGCLHGLLSAQTVTAHLGRGRFGPVFKAALLGVPLPLCSCGVLPAAMGLKAKGATKAATLSFLVSTPESGVDSIALTYALMDPILTVARPLSAFLTAILAGISEAFFGRQEEPELEPAPPSLPLETPPLSSRLRMGFDFAFGSLIRDLAPWLAAGIVAAGAVTALVPEGWIEAHIGGGFSSMLAALALGVPMYICATASTPLAAALILKGLSPGAALVFLLSGPATNAASIVVLWRQLGWATTARYLASISVGALSMGLILNAVYDALGIQAASSLRPAAAESHSLDLFWVALLALAILRAFWSGRSPRGLAKPGFS
jgi:uncharacterized membrane protein YraQ (UPF0718 family)